MGGEKYQGCSKRVPTRMKRKVDKTVARPTVIYGLETVALRK